MGNGEAPAASRARLVLVGVRGFGQVHAERITRLADQGLVELVAAVDPGVVLDPPTIYGADLYADLAEALSAVGPVDVVVIAAPLSEHFRLAQLALSSGADVYLEKPPVTSLDQFSQLLDLEQETGRVVQVGFQSLGSQALEMLQRIPSASARWPGSAPWEPGREPSATGAAHPGRAAVACAAGPLSTASSPIRWPMRWSLRWRSPAAERWRTSNGGTPISTAPTPSTVTTRRWYGFAPLRDSR